MKWVKLLGKIMENIIGKRHKNRPIFYAWEIKQLLQYELDHSHLIFLMDTIYQDWIWYENEDYTQMIEKITRKIQKL